MTVGDGSAEMGEAFEQIEAAQAELEAAEYAHLAGVMTLSGQSREDSLALLTLATKTLASRVEELKEVPLADPSKVGESAKEVAYAMTEMSSAVKGVSGTTPDRATQVFSLKFSE